MKTDIATWLLEVTLFDISLFCPHRLPLSHLGVTMGATSGVGEGESEL